MTASIKEWLKDLFLEEYVVVIWFAKKAKRFSDGEVIIEYGKPKRFRLRSISKITQTELVGVDIKGNPVILKTDLPFNYNLVKIH